MSLEDQIADVVEILGVRTREPSAEADAPFAVVLVQYHREPEVRTAPRTERRKALPRNRHLVAARAALQPLLRKLPRRASLADARMRRQVAERLRPSRRHRAAVVVLPGLLSAVSHRIEQELKSVLVP